MSEVVKLTIRQRQVLKAVPTISSSSAEIAGALREETHWIASPLKALEKKGAIELTARGGKGLPSHWRITPLGRSALSAAQVSK